MMITLDDTNEKGFTLIELMVVIAIIGIIAAIAIPQFTAYRQRSYLTALRSDARNLANAQEAYFGDNDAYCNTVATLTGAPYGAVLSRNSAAVITIVSANAIEFNLTVADATHGLTVTYDSDGGGLQ